MVRRESRLTKSNPLEKASFYIFFFFFPLALRSDPSFTIPQVLSNYFSARSHATYGDFSRKTKFLSVEIHSLHRIGSKSHSGGHIPEFVIIPSGQEDLQLCFQAHRMAAAWGMSIQEVHQQAVDAHSSLSCPQLSKG